MLLISRSLLSVEMTKSLLESTGKLAYWQTDLHSTLQTNSKPLS
jgi:hypothetical protein